MPSLAVVDPARPFGVQSMSLGLSCPSHKTNHFSSLSAVVVTGGVFPMVVVLLLLLLLLLLCECLPSSPLAATVSSGLTSRGGMAVDEVCAI